MQPHTNTSKPESTLPRGTPAEMLDSHLVDAFNVCAEALDFLTVVDLALAKRDEIPTPGAVCTVLGHVAGLVERARDAAEWARKGPPHD